MKIHNLLRMPISVSINRDGVLDSVFVQGNSVVELPQHTTLDTNWLHSNQGSIKVIDVPKETVDSE